jgi:hypothetical protein
VLSHVGGAGPAAFREWRAPETAVIRREASLPQFPLGQTSAPLGWTCAVRVEGAGTFEVHAAGIAAAEITAQLAPFHPHSRTSIRPMRYLPAWSISSSWRRWESLHPWRNAGHTSRRVCRTDVGRIRGFAERGLRKAAHIRSGFGVLIVWIARDVCLQCHRRFT